MDTLTKDDHKLLLDVVNMRIVVLKKRLANAPGDGIHKFTDTFTIRYCTTEIPRLEAVQAKLALLAAA